MAGTVAPNIVTNRLVMYLDAANTTSYPFPYTGSSWFDLTGNLRNATLFNGPTFSSANSGSIVFDGVNDFGRLPEFNGLQPSAELTLEVWFKSSGSNSRIQGLL